MSNTQKAPSGRVKRVRVGVRNRLTVEGKKDGFYYYIANADKPGRIQELLRAGYEHVPAKDVIIGDSRQNVAPVEGAHASIDLGGGAKGMLMMLPQEYRDEDLAAREASIDELEDTMRKPARSSKNPTKEGEYGEVRIGSR